MEITLWLAAIPSAVMGLITWWLKRYIDKRDARAKEVETKHAEMEQEISSLIIKMIDSERETKHLCTAIARAVQRIPDAHCNGDMTSALERVEKAMRDEKSFLINHGIYHIFEQ